MLRNKRGERLDDIVTLNKNSNYIIKKGLVILKKEGDPGVPTIPINIRERRFAKALCDLGSGMSLMPLSIAWNLGLVKELKYTPVALQLMDKSTVIPNGIVEDILVQVEKFLVLANFIILDIEEDKKVPLILGRPFLAMADTEIRAKNNVVTFYINGETIVFDVEEGMKHPRNGIDCF